MSNVSHLKKPAPEAATLLPATDAVTPFMADAIGQSNQGEREDEETTHQQIAGLVQQLNVIDAQVNATARESAANQNRWAESSRPYATHRHFIAPVVFFAITLVVAFSEWFMGTLNLQGLGLADAETYVASAGITGAGILVAKSIAYLIRLWQPENDAPRRRQLLVMTGLSTAFLIVTLIGMSLARVSFAEADAEQHQTGFTGVALLGLGLLQFALYGMQVATFWAYLPDDIHADVARRNYLATQKRLVRLHRKRARIATKLDMLVNRYRARHDARVETGKRLISQYLQALHRLNKGELLPIAQPTIKDGWFLPVSGRISAAVDEHPASFSKINDTSSTSHLKEAV